MEENKPWYGRVWGMTLLAILFLMLVGSVFFVRQVYVFYNELKDGKKPAFLVERRFSGTPNSVAKPDIDLTAIRQKTLGKGDEPFAGPATSSHEIVEFLDFDCQYSKSALNTVHDIIRTRPEIKVIIRDYPLTDIHPDAEQEALAARCVWKQGKPDVYWKYHDLLFANQDRHDADSLKQFAYQAGADSRFETCTQTSQTAGGLQQSMMDATALGVSVTPTFFVDGQIVEGAADAQYLLGLIK
ncbi:MAG: thioredoxin domain-containing protein [Patescibacteria group bacterium]|nr:thioredoxin domain-containing protein [Patescibacteria group bacterium]